MSSQIVTFHEIKQPHGYLLINICSHLLTNIIIHDSVQMAALSKQMCDTVIVKGAVRII